MLFRSRIAAEISALAAAPDRRARMARAAAALGRPQAASAVALDLFDLARARGPRVKEAC